jgi:hypothetical protein
MQALGDGGDRAQGDAASDGDIGFHGADLAGPGMAFQTIRSSECRTAPAL